MGYEQHRASRGRPQNKEAYEQRHKQDRKRALLMFQRLEFQASGMEGAKALRHRQISLQN